MPSNPHRLLRALLLLTGTLLASVACGDGAMIGRVTQVADGDTLTLTIGDARHRIRLGEIDAPEQDQPWGREARRALADKVHGQYVRVVVATVDDYGRQVGKVWLGNRDINRELVREGHAWAFRRYLNDATLLDDEARAREGRIGLWRDADPVPPWQWRHNARADAAPGASAGCVIKGNINRRGDRIYHRPGDRDYAQTRIDSGRGERWFCSAEEAERAGWRRPR